MDPMPWNESFLPGRLVLHLHFVAAAQIHAAVAAGRAVVFDMQLEVAEFAVVRILAPACVF